MESIHLILRDILESYGYTRESLAEKLGVSPSTIGRWLNAESVPRPLIEGELREIYASIQATKQYIAEQRAIYELPLLIDESSIKEALDKILIELRETLHRRGRLSSRNEALDELSKLLFAHIMSESGISKKTILGKNTDNVEGAAQSLTELVRRAFDKYLPKSLGCEMGPDDFALKLKVQEDILAIEIIEAFERLTYRSQLNGIDSIRGVDVLNDVFSKFLADSFINEKELGQYLTPTEVVRFMVRLAIRDMSTSELNILCDPSKCVNFGIILDPSCGVGSFLTEIIRILRSEVIETHGVKCQSVWIQNMVTRVVAGIDKSERMIRLALTNMAMFGFPAAQLHLTNALAQFGSDYELTKSLEGRVNLILTNPPFGAEFHGTDLLKYKIANKSNKSLTSINSELLFIERYLDWLAPGGQFLAIVPDSILTNKGIYQDLRQSTRDTIDIRSVVSLPEVTFRAAGTNTKTSILHIRKLKDSSKKQNATFFAVCQDVGFSVRIKNSHRTKTTNGCGDLPRILQAFSGLQGVSNYGRWVTNVERSSRWDANYHMSLPIKVEQRINNPAEDDVLLSNVAQLSDDRTDPRRWGTGDFQYVEISDIDSETCIVRAKTIPCTETPSRARKLVRAGDVLFSTVRPERRTVGVVQAEQDGFVCSTGLAVLRPQGIHPLVLAYLLKTDFVTIQILRNTLGIAYPVIDEQCLLDILLPIKKQKLDTLRKQADLLLELEKQIQTMRINFISSLTGSSQDWETRS